MEGSADKLEVRKFEVSSHREALKLSLDELERRPSAFLRTNRFRIGGQRLAIAAATCLILITAVTLLTIWWPWASTKLPKSASKTTKNPATTSSQVTSSPPPSGGSPSAGVDSYVRDIQAGIEPHLPGPAISASEAKAKTGISVRLPKNTKLTGNLKGIY